MDVSEQLQVAARVVNAGLKLVTFRLEVLLCVLLTFAGFAWCVYQPDPYRIVAATLFAIFALAVIKSTQPKEVKREIIPPSQ